MPRYFITIPDSGKLASAGEFAFRSVGAEGLAEELQAALRGDALFQRWVATQDDPDGVDPRLAATDPSATVEGRQDDLHIDLIIDSALNGEAFKHRMRLLAGSHWQLRDVR